MRRRAVDLQHKQLLKDLEAKLAATDAAAEKYETRFTEASKTVCLCVRTRVCVRV